ncbi:MAG: hypothetical protein B7Z15_16750, partial [Rhizobiales bacterium 32-66-8]
DIDHFKGINDTYGHTAGDAALQLVAERLTAGIRDSDTVCRYGGDEFVLVLPDVPDEAAAQQIADKLQAALALPGCIDGHVQGLPSSLGIAIYPEDGTDPATLIARADSAMYRQRRLARS